jgi:1-phosphofructokinase
VVHSQSTAGGKGVNAAAFLADYGLQVTVTGFLGAENPVLFERLFAEKGIADRFVRLPGSTRTGIKISDDTRQQTTDINFPGLAPTPTQIEELFQVVESLVAYRPWFVMSGSLPPGCPVDIYASLVRLAAQHGCPAALDTSGEALREALPAAPALVKPNIDELRAVAGRSLETQSEIIAAARDWLALGIETVVVSMGKNGALFVEADEVVLAVPPTVHVRSTVGAGDAMLSGTVAGKMQGLSLPECARLATAFSLVAITNLGAGIPSLEALQDYRHPVSVISI